MSEWDILMYVHARQRWCVCASVCVCGCVGQVCVHVCWSVFQHVPVHLLSVCDVVGIEDSVSGSQRWEHP